MSTISISGTGAFNHYQQKTKYSGIAPVTLLAVERQGGSFQCCGARCVYSMGGYFGTPKNTYLVYDKADWHARPKMELGPDDEELFNLKADFVTALLNGMGSQYTIYGIVTTTQLQSYRDNPRTVLNLLFELGAEIVDSRPNMVHGPNNMDMLVWCPDSHLDKVNKYSQRNVNKLGSFGSPPWANAPNPFAKKKEEAAPVKAVFPQKVEVQPFVWEELMMIPNPTAVKARPPSKLPHELLRDVQGRFTKAKV